MDLWNENKLLLESLKYSEITELYGQYTFIVKEKNRIESILAGTAYEFDDKSKKRISTAVETFSTLFNALSHDAMHLVYRDTTVDIPGLWEDRVVHKQVSTRLADKLSPIVTSSLVDFIKDLARTRIPMLDRESAALLSQAIATAQTLNSDQQDGHSTPPPVPQRNAKTTSESRQSAEDLRTDSSNSSPDKSAKQSAKHPLPTKKSSFGFSKMLSGLTKGRPKPKRKGQSREDHLQDASPSDAVQDDDELENSESNADLNAESEVEAAIQQVSETPNGQDLLVKSIKEANTDDADATEGELDENGQINAKKPLPTNAMMALASVMRTGQSKKQASDEPETTDDVDASKESPPKPAARPNMPPPSPVRKSFMSLSNDDLNPQQETKNIQSPPQSAENSVDSLQQQVPMPPVKPRNQPPPVAPRPKSSPFPDADNPVKPDSTEQSPTRRAPAVAPRPKSEFIVSPSSETEFPNIEVKDKNVLPPIQPRLKASDRTQSGVDSASQSPPAESGEAEAPVKKIPGIYGKQHGALGALAAAMQTRAKTVHSDTGRDSQGRESVEEPAPETNATSDPSNVVEDAPTSSPLKSVLEPPRTNPVAVSDAGYLGTPLVIKKKENTISGDDKLIEKKAIEWMNAYLQSQNINVDDLYTAFEDGLNLIYALESRTGESVGRYNKKPMMGVHRIDNTAVALTFLARHGVSTQFLQPLDLLNGDKGKILALFTYILKVFP